MKLLPFIDLAYARAIQTRFDGLSPDEARTRAGEIIGELQLRVRYFETGGERLPFAAVQQLCNRIRQQMKGIGYGSAKARKPHGRTFDLLVARNLHAFFREHDVPLGQAARDGFWHLLTCGLLPDLVVWRWSKYRAGTWGNVSRDHWTSFIRGTFSLPWWWTHVFTPEGSDEPQWSLLEGTEALTSDNVVQIAERPGIAGQPGLGVCIGRTHQRYAPWFAKKRLPDPDAHAKSLKGGNAWKPEWLGHESLLRDVMKRAMRRGAFVDWTLLSRSEQDASIEQLFQESASALESWSIAYFRSGAGREAGVATPDAPSAPLHPPTSGSRDDRPPTAPAGSATPVEVVEEPDAVLVQEDGGGGAVSLEPVALQRAGLPDPGDALREQLYSMGVKDTAGVLEMDMFGDQIRRLSAVQRLTLRVYARNLKRAMEEWAG